MPTTSQVPADAVPASWVEHAGPRVKPYLQLMRLDRPIGAWLLYWPCVFGLLLGAAALDRPFDQWRDFYLVILFGLGAVVMRGAGCTFNDIIDRKIDAAVARTAARPIPSGRVVTRHAVLFMLALCLTGLAVLAQLNALTIGLGLASLLLVAAYPFMKRITWWPQAWLGLTFNWGALMGFTAMTGRIDAPVLILYAGLICWTLGYDTIYALQDVEDDALIGVKSTARLFGDKAGQWILGFYAGAFALILAAGFAEHAGWIFFPVMLAAGAHLLWQARALGRTPPLTLFRANREVGALVALAFALASWLA